MLGVGKDVPLATGNGSEALLALVDGKFMTFRVPYPMGFYAKGIDGRIDDPKGGWKGKGIWSTYATRAPFHAEGGKGTTSKLVKFQVRNSPPRKSSFVSDRSKARTIRTSRTIRCFCARCWPSSPPGLVAFIVPLLIAWPRVREGSFNALALILLIPGIALLLWCVRGFLVSGKGTLAPWDPPRNLVSSGPYRFSRNPMAVGVSLILLGRWRSGRRPSVRVDRDGRVSSARGVQ